VSLTRWWPARTAVRAQALAGIDLGSWRLGPAPASRRDGDGGLELLAAGPVVVGCHWRRPTVSKRSRDTATCLPRCPGRMIRWPVLACWPRPGGGLRVSPPGLAVYPHLVLSLSGGRTPPSMRSNASGIGARVSVRVDSRWTSSVGCAGTPGPARVSSPERTVWGRKDGPIRRVDWSDGVFQSELNLAPAASTRSRRSSASSRAARCCSPGTASATPLSPTSWGRGAGYATGPGEYAVPRRGKTSSCRPGSPSQGTAATSSS